MPINGRYYGIEFLGTQATLFVDRERYELRPEPTPGTRVQDIVAVEPTVVAATAPDAHPSHQRNFIDCVKSRQAPICDIEIGHRSSRPRSSATWHCARARPSSGTPRPSGSPT